jgi:hypothetical protein
LVEKLRKNELDHTNFPVFKEKMAPSDIHSLLRTGLE